MNSYRILLADDQEIFRNGIRNILCQQKEFKICGETSNNDDFLQIIDKSNPDLVILEIDLPRLDGLEILNSLKKADKQAKVLILTRSKKREIIHLALNHGVDGFILKEEPSSELLRAVQVIRDGGKFFSALLSAEIMSLISTRKRTKPFFTNREREILQQTAEGMRSKEIAQNLNISIYTVNRHHHNIKKKLNLKHMTELIKYCLMNKDNL